MTTNSPGDEWHKSICSYCMDERQIRNRKPTTEERERLALTTGIVDWSTIWECADCQQIWAKLYIEEWDAEEEE